MVCCRKYRSDLACETWLNLTGVKIAATSYFPKFQNMTNLTIQKGSKIGSCQAGYMLQPSNTLPNPKFLFWISRCPDLAIIGIHNLLVPASHVIMTPLVYNLGILAHFAPWVFLGLGVLAHFGSKNQTKRNC